MHRSYGDSRKKQMDLSACAENLWEVSINESFPKDEAAAKLTESDGTVEEVAE